MNVSLTKQLERMVNDLVKDGRYGSASEVVRDGLRLVEQQEAMRQAVREGMDDIKRGNVVDGPAALRRLRQRAIRAVQRGAPARRRAG